MISIAIEPCGHTVCELCAAYTQNTDKCPFCRETVKHMLKIYL